MYHQPSKKGGCFICPWVKNESQVGPQQPQIGGIESSFFLPTGTSNDVCTREPFSSLFSALKKKVWFYLYYTITLQIVVVVGVVDQTDSKKMEVHWAHFKIYLDH